jgi:hypothetical protein
MNLRDEFAEFKIRAEGFKPHNAAWIESLVQGEFLQKQERFGELAEMRVQPGEEKLRGSAVGNRW